MRLKLISRGIAVIGALSVVGLAVNGCATENSELFIRAVADSPPGQCIIKPEADAQVRLVGVHDLAFGQGYLGVLLWGNQLIARGSNDLVRAEPNRVGLESADVSVQLSDGSEITSYSVPTSGFADPTIGGLPGFGLAEVTLVDYKSAKAAFNAGKHTLVSKVRLFGKTLGGSNVQTNEFTFVLSLCNGCTITYLPANNDTSQQSPNCFAALTNTMATTSTTAAPCLLGQDYPVDCSQCATSSKACLTGPGPLP